MAVSPLIPSADGSCANKVDEIKKSKRYKPMLINMFEGSLLIKKDFVPNIYIGKLLTAKTIQT
jgi:hypothetical protein